MLVGSLAQVPFSHLLIELFDKRHTGALYLEEPRPAPPAEAATAPHVIRFVRGAPVKLKPGDRHALLGELLVRSGAITEATLTEALKLRGLLGDVLLVAEAIDRQTLERTLERQLATRMVRMFALPPETTFRFVEGDRALADWGGEPASVDPLATLWLGLRYHGEHSSAMEPTLARLGEKPIRLHPAIQPGRFGFVGDELAAMRAIQAGPITLPELIASGIAPARVLRRMAYALMVARALPDVSGGPPVGVDDTAARGFTSNARALSVVGLRAITVPRFPMAALDEAGDGERGPGARRREDTVPNDTVTRSRHTTVMPPPSSGSRVPVNAPTPATPTLGRSSRREIPVGLPAAALFQLATQWLAELDLPNATKACALAHQSEPTHPDYAALHVRLRAMMPGADLRALVGLLDPVIAAHDEHVHARYVRALLRVRLGEDAAALRDLKRVLDMDPTHRDAKRDIDVVEARQKKSAGVLSRLFKR